MWWHEQWWWWGFGVLHMILFWAVLIVAIVLLARWLSGASHPDWMRRDRAIDILKERYARGEIGKDEFEQKKRDLLL